MIRLVLDKVRSWSLRSEIRAIERSIGPENTQAVKDSLVPLVGTRDYDQVYVNHLHDKAASLGMNEMVTEIKDAMWDRYMAQRKERD